MASPTGSVSDLLASHSGVAGGRSGTALDTSTFIDPFSEANPFAEEESAMPSYIASSQSLNFGEYYPQSSTAPRTKRDSDDDDDDDDIGTTGNSVPFYGSSTLEGSFTGMNISGRAESGHDEPPLSTSPNDDPQDQHDSDGGGVQRFSAGTGGHQRWNSVDSINRYDSDDQQHPTGVQHVGHYRPGSMRSLNSQMSFRLPENGVLPWFEITVGEPQKVGDVISPHIVYKVHIKTNSTAFRSNDFTVQRRYRDFLWLYNQLTTHNPGVIVPPVSEKHAIGRFQDEFVESRRIALERCLRKMTAHPMLYGDPDLKLFLESESLVAEIKEKRQDSKGFMTKVGETLSSATTFTKVQETDEWFESRRNQLDVLESQLRSLLKAVEAIIKQRKDLGVASSEFGESIVSLAGTELNKPLANSLLVLGNLKIRIKELHEKQAHMDVLTLEHTVDEYIRTIGSIRNTFLARVKFNQNMVQAQNDLAKKRANYEKMSQPSRKTKPERLLQLQQEIIEAEQRVNSTKRDFEEISSLIRQEFDRFDREKVEDFKQSIEAFLASMVQHQREIVSLWENYFKTLSGAGAAAGAGAGAGAGSKTGAGAKAGTESGGEEEGGQLQSPIRHEQQAASAQPLQDHSTLQQTPTNTSFSGGTPGIQTSSSNDILSANEWTS